MTGGGCLRLCKEETDLLSNLQQLKQQGVFQKIVVILNSSSTLQLDFVDKYGMDAVLWTGNLGIYIGCRYYETRYADYVLGRGNAGEYDYSADVAFPFG